ncbi:MAG: hypothetical protein QM754_08295 [Tepidisphaeraceae bacterium]
MTLPKTPIRLACLLSTALLVAGCNVAGALLYKFTPEADVPSRFTLRDVPTIVLAENFRNPDMAANDAELLGRCVQDELIKYKVVQNVVKSEKIADLRNNHPKDFPKMSVPEIAKEIGAEQVIYIDLVSSGIGSMTGSSMFQGRASALVKVIDAKTGKIAWPPDSTDGFGVNYETNPLKGREEGSYASVRSDLYEGLGKNIGRLFHAWKQSEDDDDKRPSM